MNMPRRREDCWPFSDRTPASERPTRLALDQVVVHTDGNTAVVCGRTSRQPGRYGRYVDTYERRDGAWLCVHACVWPLPASARGAEVSGITTVWYVSMSSITARS